MFRRASIGPGGPADPVLVALMAALLVYYAATPGIFEGKASGDGLVDFYFLPSVFVHHTLDVTAASVESRHWPMPVMNGRMTSYLPVGPPIAWAPLYLASLAIEKAARPFGALAGEPFGVNRFSYWMCGLATLLWALGGLVLVHRLAERRLGRGPARFGVIGLALGTPLAWYLVTQPLYQHGLSFAAGAAFVERWDAWRPRLTLKRCLALGALGGAAALVRQQDALWLLLPAADLAAAAVRGAPGAAMGRALGMGAAACAVFVPQLLAWLFYYGVPWSPLADVPFMRWDAPSFVGVLFSARAGLFAWSPIVYFAVIGLWLGRRRLGATAALLALVLAAQACVNASVWDWWAGWSFGARRFTGLGVVFALGLGALWAQVASRRSRAVLAAAATACIAVNLLAMEALRALPMSSTDATRAAWERLDEAGAPATVVAVLRTVGWPACWPASIPFALRHRVPVRTFEEVYGGYFCYRDFWNHQVRDAEARLDRPDMRRYLAVGFGEPEAAGGLVRVDGTRTAPARFLAPLFRRERMRVHIDGVIAPVGAAEVRWNDEPVDVHRTPEGLAFDLPAARVRGGVNEIALALPPGSGLSAVRFEPADVVLPGFEGPPWARRPGAAR